MNVVLRNLDLNLQVHNLKRYYFGYGESCRKNVLYIQFYVTFKEG